MELIGKPTGTTYEIRTLRDIFNLPTHDAMMRCLNELGDMMGSARAYAEMLEAVARDLAKKDGKEFPDGPAFAWPETVKWTDDGGIAGSSIRMNGPDGKELTTLAYKKT